MLGPGSDSLEVIAKINPAHDVLIIGGGHNGLVSAGYLARGGFRVLVLERRSTLGGAASTLKPFPGFTFDIGAQDAGLLLPEIVRDLELARHGLTLIDSPIRSLSLSSDASVLHLWRDSVRAAKDLAAHSSADAVAYPGFLTWAARLTAVLGRALTLTPPNLPAEMGPISAWLGWARIAVAIRRLGRAGMMGLLRTIPLSVENLLDDWFESPILKGALGSLGVAGSAQGPKAPGTALMMLYQGAGGLPRPSRFVSGGSARLIQALASAARSHGAEIRTEAEVERILVDEGRAIGVRLTNGEEIRASVVASSADPRHTLFDLVGPSELEVRVVRRIQNIRFRGTTARMNLAIGRLPKFSGVDDPSELLGHILLCPSLDYLERAYDDSKYGRYSQRPYLDMVIPSLHHPANAPNGSQVLSVTMQYAPYQLAGSSWEHERERLGDRIVAAIAEHAPELPGLIIHRQVITPLDFEREYRLPEGNFNHGEMGLDQLLSMRPIPGHARYRSPVAGLYFSGAGAHPGGGLTGAPGYNAAREIRLDLNRRRRLNRVSGR